MIRILINKKINILVDSVKKCSSVVKIDPCNKKQADDEIEKNKPLLSFDDLPGPRNYPVIGTLYKYMPFIGEYDAEALHKIAWLNWTRYGAITKECPGVRLVHLVDPDDIAAVFRNDDRFPLRRSHTAMLHYRLSKPQVYNTGGLLATNGPDWWKLRSTFQKNFTSPQSVKAHISSTDAIIKDFVKWIKVKKVSHTEDFLPYLNRLNLEIIGLVAFNKRFNSFSASEQGPESRSSKIIKSAFGSNSGVMKLDKGFLWKIFSTPLYKNLVKSQEYLEKIAKDILMNKVNFHQISNEDDNSLLSSFLKHDNINLKDITGIMVDILMASIDTTAYSTSFLLYHISRNEACQKKLFTEVNALLPNKESAITDDILSKATYARSCIKESLRLNPVSVGVGRVLKSDLIIKNYLLPKDTVIVTQNMLASRLPQYVKDPLNFKPERWLRGSAQYEKMHPFLSLPFGFGPRSCIARRLAEQNMQIALIRLAREFHMNWKGGELGIITHLINKPDKPISLAFLPRVT